MVHWSKKEEAKNSEYIVLPGKQHLQCSYIYTTALTTLSFQGSFEFQNKTLSFLNKIRYTRGYQNERRLMQKNIIIKPCMLTNLIRNIKQQIFQKSSQVLQYLTILSSNTPLSFMTFDNFIVFEMLPSLLWHKFLQDTR